MLKIIKRIDRSIIINFSVTESFIPILDEFEMLIENDELFKKSLETLSARYRKKSKNNCLRSAKLRFVIAKYMSDRKKELRKISNEKMLQTKTSISLSTPDLLESAHESGESSKLIGEDINKFVEIKDDIDA